MLSPFSVNSVASNIFCHAKLYHEIVPSPFPIYKTHLDSWFSGSSRLFLACVFTFSPDFPPFCFPCLFLAVYFFFLASLLNLFRRFVKELCDVNKCVWGYLKQTKKLAIGIVFVLCKLICGWWGCYSKLVQILLGVKARWL